jgi:uncharacterized protein (TIGR02284 family)
MMEPTKTFDVLDELMQTLEDGMEGFESALEKLDPVTSQAEITLFGSLIQQRRDFRQELRTLSATMDHEVKETGTVAAKLHRSWMGLKDLVSGSDAGGVVDAAEQGEAHALKVFTEACAQDLPTELKVVVEHQRSAIAASHAHIEQLKLNKQSA